MNGVSESSWLDDNLEAWGFISGKGHTCQECVRFRQRPDGVCKCTDIHKPHPINPDDAACKNYWDRKIHDAYEKAEFERHEAERLAAIEKGKLNPPVELPIVFDGYGEIPMCPNCNNPPYDMEQCQCCGQRFLPSKAIEEYSKPLTEEMLCFNCGAPVTAYKSRYNGHRNYSCAKCGCCMME